MSARWRHGCSHVASIRLAEGWAEVRSAGWTGWVWRAYVNRALYGEAKTKLGAMKAARQALNVLLLEGPDESQ